MARVTVEDCLDHVENRFDLVLKASKRAHYLELGSAEPMVPRDNDKPTVIALREIASGFDVTKPPVVVEEVLTHETIFEDTTPNAPITEMSIEESTGLDVTDEQLAAAFESLEGLASMPEFTGESEAEKSVETEASAEVEPPAETTTTDENTEEAEKPSAEADEQD